ncbi:MAG: hypothetical protein V3W04_00380 [Gammaproteobacteria bacterium]
MLIVLLFLQACSDDKEEESEGKANSSTHSVPVTGKTQFQNPNVPGNVTNYRPMPANAYPESGNPWSQQMPSTNNPGPFSAGQYPSSGYSQNQGYAANQYRPLESTASTAVQPTQNSARVYAPVAQPYYAPGRQSPGHQYGAPNYVPPVPAYGTPLPGGYPGYAPQGGYSYPYAGAPPAGGYVAPGAW